MANTVEEREAGFQEDPVAEFVLEQHKIVATDVVVRSRPNCTQESLAMPDCAGRCRCADLSIQKDPLHLLLEIERRFRDPPISSFKTASPIQS